MSPRSVHWRSWEMNGSKKLMCDEDHIEQRQVHSPDDRESPPAPVGMVGDGTGTPPGWSWSHLFWSPSTRDWHDFYFAFFGEAFNHFVKCFSPDYLWALGHGLHLRMDFAVMFSVELFHCSAAMKVCGDLCKLRGSPLPAAPQSMGLIWCAVWTACGLVNIFTSNCLFFTPRRVRGLVRWMSELNQSGEILHLHKWQSVVLKLSNQNTEKNFWVCR